MGHAVELRLKKTALNTWHNANGGKLVPFAGWEMPLQYQRVNVEHAAVRAQAGLFDVSHMGILAIHHTEGNQTNVCDWLNTVVPNHIPQLDTTSAPQAIYTQFLNEYGGILDDCILYQNPAYQTPGQDVPHPVTQALTPYFIICNAANTDTNLKWLNSHCPSSISVKAVESLSLFALQGPAFINILAELDINKADLPQRFTSNTVTASLNRQIIPLLLSRTGYTGNDGVEIMVSNRDAITLWEGLIATKTGCLPIGLAARDTLRLEAAYPLHGQDITPDTTPLEAGLGWSVKLDKPQSFIGKQPLLEQKDTPNKRFICLHLQEKAIARTGFEIVCLDNQQPVGTITSGTLLPEWAVDNAPIPDQTIRGSIAMGYINPNACPAIGDKVGIRIRNKIVEATRVKRPFYKGV
jgi:aminomethyltransferase